MDTFRQALMQMYYHGTVPYRALRRHRACAAGRAPVAILLFHRVADDMANQWTTPTQEFVRAIHWLKDRFEIVSLEEAQRRIRSQASHRPCVSITFDDGYAENSRVALPLLIREQIPCTYFVTVGPVLSKGPFHHDVEMGNNFAPNSIEDLREAAAGGIEIGAHTRSHPNMGAMTDRDEMYDELVTARDDLQQAIGQRIRYFAFPFGTHRNMNVQAFEMAREAGYEAVCSAYGGYNFPGDDAFHLQRRGVDGSLIRMKNWVTVDPLRDPRVQRFVYQQGAAVDAPAGVATVS
jgi:peptidoglycan/xylan/chitin deacetylase (PgdA/CDA1 family)